MSQVIAAIVQIIWGLWFGGLVLLFMALQSIFNAFSDRRELAGETASALFRVFGKYHLILAAIALLSSFIWRVTRPGKSKTLLICFFAVATLAAVYVTGVLTPRIELLRLDHLTDSAEFRSLHGRSMIFFLLETLFVLLAGLILPWQKRSRTAPPPALQI